MRYFIHIVTDCERILDPEGAEFDDLDAAGLEASQSARDLVAAELTGGRPVPFGWQVQIADRDCVIHRTIPFSRLICGEDLPLANSAHLRRDIDHHHVIEASKATVATARGHYSEIRSSLSQIWSQLQTLGRMNAALGSFARLSRQPGQAEL